MLAGRSLQTFGGPTGLGVCLSPGPRFCKQLGIRSRKWTRNRPEEEAEGFAFRVQLSPVPGPSAWARHGASPAVSCRLWDQNGGAPAPGICGDHDREEQMPGQHCALLPDQVALGRASPGRDLVSSGVL